ncbi:MAG TPA: terminase, partial [Thermoanaerobaculia bacterium]|nr:terminase [Thermoanaerobaculia bacterium]
MTLDRVMKLALNPARLMVEAGMDPDPWQREAMTSEATRSLILATRQGGKSSVAACRSVWEAICRPPALVVMLSPSLRQSSELFRKALDAWR